MLTRNFSRDELSCKCGCNECRMNLFFLLKLQDLRDKWNRPLEVISGFRCKEHNSSPAVKGKPNSFHLIGRACDIAVSKDDQTSFIKLAESIGLVAVSICDMSVHVDNGETRTWVY